jgi:hypothetical protein
MTQKPFTPLPTPKRRRISKDFVATEGRIQDKGRIGLWDRVFGFPVEVDTPSAALKNVSVNQKLPPPSMSKEQRLRTIFDAKVVGEENKAMKWYREPTFVSQKMMEVMEELTPIIENLDKATSLKLAENYLEACFSLQDGAKAQASLRAKMIADLMKSVVMLTTNEVAERAGVTTQTVASWVFRDQIFGVRAGAKGVTYPDFQFDPIEKLPYQSLKQTLPQLQEHFEPIGLLMWFCAPNAALSGAKPISVIGDASRLQAVVDASLTPIEGW